MSEQTQTQPPVPLPQPPVLAPSTAPQPALTGRSLATALFVALGWIVLLSWSLPTQGLIQQQLILLTGFGALLTVFFVKFIADFFPHRRRLNAAELTFVFAMTLSAIPCTVMGRMALESAVAHHFLDGSEAGRRGWISDIWAPNPHIGLLPRLDPPDARCPYLELPPMDNGTARRPATPPPSIEECNVRATAAVDAAAKANMQTRGGAAKVAPSREVLDTSKAVDSAAALAAEAAAELRTTKDAARAAYLMWTAEMAAQMAASGPQRIINADAVNSFRKGKSAVPWSMWLLPLLYWFGVMLAFCLVLLFGLLALREAWIERERLPFPYAQIAHGSVCPAPNEPSESPKHESFPSVAVGIAFVVGLLFCVKGMVTISDTGGAATPPNYALLDLDLSWLDLIKGVNIRLVIMPFALLILLFFPVDLLMTVVGAYVIAAFGLPFAMETLGITDRIDFRYHVLWMGGMLGITAFIIIFHFRELARLVSGLWQRATGDRERQPLTPRELSIGFLLALTVFCLLVIIGEGETSKSLATQALMLLYVLVMVTMYNLPYMRINAGGGFGSFEFNNILHVGGWYNWHWWKQIHTIPVATGSRIAEPDGILNYHALYQLETFGAYGQAVGPGSQFLNAFALADKTRSRLRDILKAVLIGMVLALAIGMPMYLMAVHTIGYDNTSMAGSWGNIFLTTDKAATYYKKIHPGIFTGTSIFWMIGGALLIGTCMYLRREYARFPIEPMGMFIAGFNGGQIAFGCDTIWFTFVIALALKATFFRWYGVRSFQEKVLPLCVYCLMGMTLGIVLYLFLSAAILSKGIAF
ncbi:MAG TPA: DUF6785 family protein [Planctomycetota bacterium]|nr:DUF6785 family protein [Planctomycetota bacterium]